MRTRPLASRNRLSTAARRQTVPVLAALLALAGCGGGGGGGGGGSASAAPAGAGNTSPNAIAAPAPAAPRNNDSIASCPTTPAPGTGTAPADAGQPGIISGRVTFERVPFLPPYGPSSLVGPGLDYGHPQPQPARGVIVEAVVPSGGVCNGTVLDTVMTDGDGWYRLSVNPTTLVCVRARAQLYRTGAPSWNIAVSDNTDGNKLYVMAESGSASANAQPSRNLHAASGLSGGVYTGARVAAPFAILDTACKAVDAVLAARPGAAFDNLNLFWSTRNTNEDGALAEGKIGGAFFSPSARAIYLRGDKDVDTDEFDEMVIAHEFGHFVTHQFSRSDSIGGEHGLNEIKDPRLAFDEGWATAFAGLTLGTAQYRDSNASSHHEFTVDIQYRNPAFPQGWFAEASVQRTLYNIGDGSGLGLGLPALLQTFMGNYRDTPALATIFSLASQLQSEQPALAAGIANILDGELINGGAVQPFADSETHEPAPTSPLPNLPLYRALTATDQGGTAQTVCSTDFYGTVNGLSNLRYLTFSPAVNSKYRFTVQPTVAGGVAGLELLDRGLTLAYREASAASPAINLVTGGALQAGRTYVLGVFHVGNITDNPSATTGARGQNCFDVAVGSTP